MNKPELGDQPIDPEYRELMNEVVGQEDVEKLLYEQAERFKMDREGKK